MITCQARFATVDERRHITRSNVFWFASWKISKESLKWMLGKEIWIMLMIHQRSCNISQPLVWILSCVWQVLFYCFSFGIQVFWSHIDQHVGLHDVELHPQDWYIYILTSRLTLINIHSSRSLATGQDINNLWRQTDMRYPISRFGAYTLIRVLKVTGNYEKARNIARQAEDTSNLNSEEDGVAWTCV